jgi:hypothetical protein
MLGTRTVRQIGGELDSIDREPSFIDSIERTLSTGSRSIWAILIILLITGCGSPFHSGPSPKDTSVAPESLVAADERLRSARYRISTKAEDIQIDEWVSMITSIDNSSPPNLIDTWNPWHSNRTGRRFQATNSDTVKYLVCAAEGKGESAVGVVFVYPSPNGEPIDIPTGILYGFFNRSGLEEKNLVHVSYFLFGAVSGEIRFQGNLSL